MKVGFNAQLPAAGTRDRLSALGHKVRDRGAAGGLGALVDWADVIFLGGRDVSAIQAEIFGSAGLEAGLRAGQILVDRSDSDAASARERAATLAARGVAIVEAPSSGHYTEDAGLAPVTYLAGTQAARGTVAPLIAGEVLDCGDTGKGHALNLFNATMGLTAYLATLEVAAMGAKFGLGLDAMARAISAGSGRNRASTIALPMLLRGVSATDMPLRQALNLLQLATEAASATGTPTFLASQARNLLQAAFNRSGDAATVEAAVDLIEIMAAAPLRALPATPTAAPEGDGSALKVGYVGVGTMGGALARRLLLSRPLMVSDVNHILVDRLVADGAVAVPDAATLARECDVIIVCVPTSTIVRQVVFGPAGLAEGLAPGKIVIDQTTGDPSETRAIARDLEAIGVQMVDAPVSGGTRGALAGTIAIICGGLEAAFARVHSILRQISPNIIYCGVSGNGHAAKLIQNAVAACNRILTLECSAAAVRSGLTLTELIAPIEAGSGWNGGASRIIPALRTGNATTDFSMGLMAKDLRLAMDIGNDLGAPMMIANAARGLMQCCANEEGSHANLDAIVTTFEKIAGFAFRDYP